MGLDRGYRLRSGTFARRGGGGAGAVARSVPADDFSLSAFGFLAPARTGSAGGGGDGGRGAVLAVEPQSKPP